MNAEGCSENSLCLDRRRTASLANHGIFMQ
uniref:Uncharacterized protein n=1 Tax=Anguilla anguilla TaxID=7936 RepID=A0A0E9QS70_ANGAN